MTPAPEAILVLPKPPSLAPLLARGALRSPFKHPHPDAAFPRTRLLLPRTRVDLARLAAYERVCGFPTGDDALPITFPHVLGFPSAMLLMSDRDFPLPLLGLVHTSIEITQHRPLPPGGDYELLVYVEKLAPHRRGTEATVVTRARTDDTVVWESRSTYLARHTTGDRPAAPDDRPATRAHDTSQEAPKPLPVLAEWHLAGDVGRRYGAASGDRNPIHLHPLTARLFGFPRAIAHGMWTVARCLAEHGTPGAAFVRAEFRTPVLLPGKVTYAAEGGRFELRGHDDRVHVTGKVTGDVAGELTGEVRPPLT
ncbi:MaoC/PaaZ C-terminal domain-containing protein [Streptomyces sp. NPDC046862]|uniref:MaoC/PaaZ C-terminal domain-containing protein n=1 Tax=Streptomyces sp. NPDC046862 TaxID=3154603 RepID=UPI0034571ED3